jgi:peptide/nickel transport system permease protein
VTARAPLDPRVRLGLAIVIALAIVAALGTRIAPRDPFAIDLLHSYAPPSLAHPFGQNQDGEDLLSEVIVGARTSFIVGISVVAISMTIGVLLGLAAGWFGGAVDGAVTAVTDFLLAFPGILLAIAITAVIPHGGLWRIVLALSVRGWVGYTRLVRASVLSLKKRPFIEAAVALGASHRRILFRHLLPNALSPVIVEATFGVAGAIRDEAALSFLGLGVEPGTPSWGALLDTGRQYLLVAPHIAIFPGLAILVTVLAFNFLGDGLRDRLDAVPTAT